MARPALTLDDRALVQVGVVGVPSGVVDPFGQLTLPNGSAMSWSFTRDGAWVQPSDVPSLRRRPFAVAGVEYELSAGGSVRQRVVGRSSPRPVASVAFIDSTRTGLVVRIELDTVGKVRVDGSYVLADEVVVLAASEPIAKVDVSGQSCTIEWALAGGTLTIDLPLSRSLSHAHMVLPLDEAELVAGWAHLGQWLPELDTPTAQLDALVRGASIDIALGDATAPPRSSIGPSLESSQQSWLEFLGSVQSSTVPDVSRFRSIEAAMSFIDATSHRLMPATTNSAQLLASFDPSWLGQPVGASRLPTAAGTLSAAVRWHGTRPALLWERLGGPDSVELTAPSLDQSFRTTDRSGEALLGEIAMPASTF